MHNIVIIEDDLVDIKDINKKIAQILNSHSLEGVHVETFSSSRLGLEWLINNDAALLILDVCLPDQDAIEMMESLSTEGVIVPVFLTSGVDQLVLSTANKVGKAADSIIVGHSMKPIPAAVLEEALKEVGILSCESLPSGIEG